ncbi:PREDICTED: leukemia inhibitory factor [Thamnophis sirtalis]|uniref:Leukemia inhibitory factor n=1 Tax=Thamnophis sirtalis TaxID=35019 RepID=A0A6I9YZB1_9SAUR|nr:PREDICTED: leukemia inhibitory factor [Thamnophis sirtalis]
MNELFCEQLLRHPRMQLSMRSLVAGVISVLLIAHCKLSSGRPLHQHGNNSMCHDVRPCKHPVFDQVRCLVSHLNLSAPALFENYLRTQGHPFTEKNKLDEFCEPDQEFPPFVASLSDKERVVNLYKIFVYFNASLDNITKDQESFDNFDSKEDLLRRLRNTNNHTAGLLSNLTCLLCSKYKVNHVDVTYGNHSSTDIFEKKQKGCQILRKYTKVIRHAAQALGHCRHKQT